MASSTSTVMIMNTTAEVVAKGFVADFALHRSKDGKNPHAHVLVTLRSVEGEGFGKKPDMSGKFNGRGSVGVAGKSDLDQWRATWEAKANLALEKAGSDKRIDRRALKDQGIDRAPEPKIGVTAVAMKRRGKVADPEQMKRARWVGVWNAVRPHANALRRHGDTFPRAKGQALAKNAPERSMAAETPMQRGKVVGEDSGRLANLRRDKILEAVNGHARDIQRTGEVGQSGGGTPWWAAVPLAMGWAAHKTVQAGKKAVTAAVDTGKKAAQWTHHTLAEARAKRALDRQRGPELER